MRTMRTAKRKEGIFLPKAQIMALPWWAEYHVLHPAKKAKLIETQQYLWYMLPEESSTGSHGWSKITKEFLHPNPGLEGSEVLAIKDLHAA
jgi:hypothetical protein